MGGQVDHDVLAFEGGLHGLQTGHAAPEVVPFERPEVHAAELVAVTQPIPQDATYEAGGARDEDFYLLGLQSTGMR